MGNPLGWAIIGVLCVLLAKRFLAGAPSKWGIREYAIGGISGLAIGLLIAAIVPKNETSSAPAVATSFESTVSPETKRRESLVFGACEAAKVAVEAKLKSPSSADFPHCVFSAHMYEVRANDEMTKFAVSGHVDAQNTFGAMLRSKFIVFLDKAGTDTSTGFSPTKVVIE